MVLAQRSRSLLRVMCLLACSLCVARAAAQKPALPSLTCGVEGSTRGARRADLCSAVGRELKRTITLVDDARGVQGEAVQIIRGDVQWTVIWLSGGRVLAWTRVSQTEAENDQVRFVVNATRALVKAGAGITKAALAKTALQNECVRLDPNGDHPMRSSDLTYPWAELKPCHRQVVEVVDPWWLPAKP